MNPLPYHEKRYAVSRVLGDALSSNEPASVSREAVMSTNGAAPRYRVPMNPLPYHEKRCTKLWGVDNYLKFQ